MSLAGPDGRLLGGGVAGLLIAASPIQVLFFLPCSCYWKQYIIIEIFLLYLRFTNEVFQIGVDIL